MGEISSVVMSADESIVQARQRLEQVTMLISGKRFSVELREVCLSMNIYPLRNLFLAHILCPVPSLPMSVHLFFSLVSPPRSTCLHISSVGNSLLPGLP